MTIFRLANLFTRFRVRPVCGRSADFQSEHRQRLQTAIRRIVLIPALIGALSTANYAQEQPSLSTVPMSYDAVTDLAPRPRPALPQLGSAGYTFNDPVFGSRIMRVTDSGVNPGFPHFRCNTASGAEQNQFNASGDILYVRCGAILLYRLNKANFTVTMIMDPARPSQPLRLPGSEPEFSHADPNVLYFVTGNTISEYKIATNRMEKLLDLEARISSPITGLAGQLSASATERIAVAFNGRQHGWRNVAVYDRKSGTYTVIDTVDATMNGQPLNLNVSFALHNVRIDKSGRYLALTPSVAYTSATSAPTYILDLEARILTPAQYRFGGHRAFGYGYILNGDVLPGDAGPSLLGRSLDPSSINNSSAVRPLLPGPNAKPFIGGVDYVSWNNARPGVMAPAASLFYQTFGGVNKFDGEIVMNATDGTGRVWRVAHHRSVPVSYDFWGYGRGSISPDGKYYLFGSNWERTLGSVVDGARTDVFLVELVQAPEAPGVLRSISFSTSSLRQGSSAVGTLALTSPAPAGGLNVTLFTSSSALSIPASVSIPAGATEATFKATVSGSVARQTQATVYATADFISMSASLILQPGDTNVEIQQLRQVNQVMGGISTSVFVQLASQAPQTGGTITVASSNPLVASVPASVAVGASAWGVAIPVKTSAVTSPQTVRITATGASGSKYVDIYVVPAIVRALVPKSSTIAPGAAMIVWLALWAPAPFDIKVPISNSCALDILHTPANMTIPKGVTGINVMITAKSMLPGPVCTIGAAGPYNQLSTNVTLGL
jgi:hypothetical protein